MKIKHIYDYGKVLFWVEGVSKMSGGIFGEAFFGVMRLRLDGWFRKYPALPKG
jgi:hypothetical protein